jgi:hypothetical protein
LIGVMMTGLLQGIQTVHPASFAVPLSRSPRLDKALPRLCWMIAQSSGARACRLLQRLAIGNDGFFDLRGSGN